MSAGARHYSSSYVYIARAAQAAEAHAAQQAQLGKAAAAAVVPAAALPPSAAALLPPGVGAMAPPPGVGAAGPPPGVGPPAAPVNEGKWHYLDNTDASHGPFTTAEMRSWYSAGYMPPNHRQVAPHAHPETTLRPGPRTPALSMPLPGPTVLIVAPGAPLDGRVRREEETEYTQLHAVPEITSDAPVAATAKDVVRETCRCAGPSCGTFLLRALLPATKSATRLS